MLFSNYQKEIFTAVKNTNKNILVQATAGSGKTTTIIEAAKLVPSWSKTCFLAFNKSIVEELKDRLPENVDCSTLHSLGMRSLYKYYYCKLKVLSSKTLKFFDDVYKSVQNEFLFSYEDLPKLKFNVSDLIDKARLNHCQSNVDELEKISDYYGILLTRKEIEFAKLVFDSIIKYNESKSQMKERIIDFTDMIYIPSYYNVTMPKYDVVFVDECQDLNRCQQILVEKIMNPKGRRIYVGDRNQSIYGFAGADVKSFDNLKKIPNTIELPLSVCYRCGINIVKEAQTVVPTIEWSENQVPGIVRNSDITEILEGDFVLCRNNAPLISLYFDLILSGKKAFVKGRELENQIIKIVDKVIYSSVEEGLDKLSVMLDKIYDEQLKKGHSDPTKTKKYQNFQEIVNIIQMVSFDKTMMLEVKDCLQEIFREDKDSVILMTVHKSKGLESDRVFILNPNLMPSRWAETEEELQQEMNLKFVAITRAKKELVYIHNYEMRHERGED